jgi:heparan-alpha-glucosaminide N-acetyltransferase
MIFVNYGAGEYGFFDHAVWNGLHLADLVFPCFMLIMGISLPLSLNALCNKSRASLEPLSTRDLVQKMLKRTLLLFLFGLLTSNDSSVTVDTIRIFGVLQRFAISYLVCASMEIAHLNCNGFLYETSSFAEDSWRARVKELVLYPLQWLTMAMFVLVWLLLTFLLPVPGCPTGYIGPGGLHEHGLHENCTGGAAGYIDRLVLGESHVYPYPTCHKIYKTKIAYDPEGVLGCLTSCVLTYLGVCVGHVIVHYEAPIRRVIRFLVYATVWGAAALVLCKASRDDGCIPINKNLWSLSFVLALASIGVMALVVFYLLMDVWNLYAGKPFIYPGENSICIYICHAVFQSCFPVQFQVPDTHSYRLAMHLWGVVLWVSIAAIMDSKKVYINL